MAGRGAALCERLPAPVRERVTLGEDWSADTVRFDAVLHHGAAERPAPRLRTMARRDRADRRRHVACAAATTEVPLERLVVERSLSINTAAAGGNASLMTME